MHHGCFHSVMLDIRIKNIWVGSNYSRHETKDRKDKEFSLIYIAPPWISSIALSVVKFADSEEA